MDKFKRMFPYMAYINLDSRKDRLRDVKREFIGAGLSPERVSGTLLKSTNNNMVNGMIGCTLSHIKILLEAKRRNKNVFIFEDDVKFINNYVEIINNACDQLKDRDWTLFYLGANILKPFNQVSDNLAKLNHAQSTVAYGVNKDKIDMVLTMLLLNQVGDHQGSKTIRPIDTIYADIIIPSTNSFITCPEMVAIQKNSYSDIEGRDVDYESYLESRYKKNLLRL